VWLLEANAEPDFKQCGDELKVAIVCGGEGGGGGGSDMDPDWRKQAMVIVGG
jgi:hypothetical protein